MEIIRFGLMPPNIKMLGQLQAVSDPGLPYQALDLALYVYILPAHP